MYYYLVPTFMMYLLYYSGVPLVVQLLLLYYLVPLRTIGKVLGVLRTGMATLDFRSNAFVFTNCTSTGRSKDSYHHRKEQLLLYYHWRKYRLISTCLSRNIVRTSQNINNTTRYGKANPSQAIMERRL
jgi:hypothetical protein